MWDHLRFIIKRLRERLWIKPLIVCALSVGAGFIGNMMDMTDLGRYLPEIAKQSTQTMLEIIASSMLMMATFAVASLVAAYASASRTATPRSFPLIVGDDLSQNVLSVFIGAFIYSVVALVALMNGLYTGKASQFFLFWLTIIVLAVIIITFIRWVDNIARLGRLGHTIDQVEAAAAEAIQTRQSQPRLGGATVYPPPDGSLAVFAKAIGYVQRVDVKALQERAEESKLRIIVSALPGTFCTPDRPVAWVVRETPGSLDTSGSRDTSGIGEPSGSRDTSGSVSDKDIEKIASTFVIGDSRVFDQDPRFGLLALSEIASRALSPAVNDPGTAIDVTGTLVRLFVLWNECGKENDHSAVKFDRVAVPELSVADLFDDAFSGIARDGAGAVEVVVRLLKALDSLAATGNPAMRDSALRQARLVLLRAQHRLRIPDDLSAVREAAAFAA